MKPIVIKKIRCKGCGATMRHSDLIIKNPGTIKLDSTVASQFVCPDCGGNIFYDAHIIDIDKFDYITDLDIQDLTDEQKNRILNE